MFDLQSRPWVRGIVAEIDELTGIVAKTREQGEGPLRLQGIPHRLQGRITRALEMDSHDHPFGRKSGCEFPQQGDDRFAQGDRRDDAHHHGTAAESEIASGVIRAIVEFACGGQDCPAPVPLKMQKAPPGERLRLQPESEL